MAGVLAIVSPDSLQSGSLGRKEARVAEARWTDGGKEGGPRGMYAWLIT